MLTLQVCLVYIHIYIYTIYVHTITSLFIEIVTGAFIVYMYMLINCMCIIYMTGAGSLMAVCKGVWIIPLKNV